MKHERIEDAEPASLEVQSGVTVVNGIHVCHWEYRPSYYELPFPEDHSRTLATYLHMLHETAPAQLRRDLLQPFTLKLANTADKETIARVRANFIALESCRRIVSLFCVEVLKRSDLADMCRAAKDNAEAYDICETIIREICPDFHNISTATCCVPSRWQGLSQFSRRSYSKALAAYNLAQACEAASASHPGRAALVAGWSVALFCSRRAPRRTKRYFTIATQILSEAILLGHAQPALARAA
jgi:hypothetical protein